MPSRGFPQGVGAIEDIPREELPAKVSQRQEASASFPTVAAKVSQGKMGTTVSLGKDASRGFVGRRMRVRVFQGRT
jgi:hypothetical protein